MLLFGRGRRLFGWLWIRLLCWYLRWMSQTEMFCTTNTLFAGLLSMFGGCYAKAWYQMHKAETLAVVSKSLHASGFWWSVMGVWADLILWVEDWDGVSRDWALVLRLLPGLDASILNIASSGASTSWWPTDDATSRTIKHRFHRWIVVLDASNLNTICS